MCRARACVCVYMCVRLDAVKETHHGDAAAALLVERVEGLVAPAALPRGAIYDAVAAARLGGPQEGRGAGAAALRHRVDERAAAALSQGHHRVLTANLRDGHWVSGRVDELGPGALLCSTGIDTDGL